MAVKVTKSEKKNPAKKSEKKAPKAKTKDEGEVMEPHAANPLVTLRDEIDRMFENALAGWSSMRMPDMNFPRPHFDMDFWRDPFSREPFRRFEGRFAELSKLSPRADMSETDGAITVTAELPGVAEADIDVSVHDGRLTISAEKKEETRKDDADYHLTERHYGSVKRSFALPDSADADKAKATFKDGVLTVEVPKKALPKSSVKKIAIKG